MDLQPWQRRGLLTTVTFLAFLMVTGTLISSLQWIHKPFPGFFLYGNLSVAPYFLAEWSGNRQGLRFLDRVVAVQGEPIAHPRALYELVRSQAAGSQFRYTIEKERKNLEVVIPSIRFSFRDWFLSFGIYLLTGLSFLVIGFTPLYLRSSSPAAAPLFFMVSAVFLWFTTTFDFMTTQLLPKELRVFAMTLTPSAGIHLGLSLTGRGQGRKGRLPLLFLIYGISFVLGLWYSLTFHSPLDAWGWSLRLGYGYSFLAALTFLGLLWAALRNPLSDLERSRLRVILVGAFLGFFLPTLGTVLTSFFAWEIPYNLSVIPAVFFPLSVAYALLKYSLFDLDVVLKVSLTRAALAGVLLLIYVFVVVLLGMGAGIYENDPLVPVFFSGLVVLVFNPLLRRIEGLVDHYIYRREYDPIELQSEVSWLLRSLSTPQSISEKYLKLLTERIGIEAASLSFRLSEAGDYLPVSVPEKTSGPKEFIPRLHSLWVRHFGVAEKGVTRGEVESLPLLEADRGEFLWVLNALEAELLIPITFKDAILGFVAFGKKRSGREYTGDDFRLLRSLAGQLALSLENGRLFEETERSKEKYQRLYDQSEALNRRLIQVDRLKKDFVANISHELRTPISTILGYTEVLLDPRFAGNARAILERVVSNGQNLAQLMDHLLDFSRIEAGTMATAVREVTLKEVFHSLELMMRRLIRNHPIQFRTTMESPVVIETDGQKLQQILMELLTNAIKFTAAGEIILGMRTLLEGGDPLVVISVSDTGIGISREDQEIIFEEFRQLDGSATRRYGGTGVGLSLCRKLAQSLGGRIEVDSEPGQGSTFSLILPLERSQGQAVSGFQSN